MAQLQAAAATKEALKPFFMGSCPMDKLPRAIKMVESYGGGYSAGDGTIVQFLRIGYHTGHMISRTYEEPKLGFMCAPQHVEQLGKHIFSTNGETFILMCF